MNHLSESEIYIVAITKLLHPLGLIWDIEHTNGPLHQPNF
jgi:hypothetical protein